MSKAQSLVREAHYVHHFEAESPWAIIPRIIKAETIRSIHKSNKKKLCFPIYLEILHGIGWLNIDEETSDKAQSNLDAFIKRYLVYASMLDSIMSEIVFCLLLNKCLSMDLFLSTDEMERKRKNLLSIFYRISFFFWKVFSFWKGDASSKKCALLC